ncbi:Pycsar system effector family protein [Streptomyces sp. NPDC017941]|uniref:Pycsar system effector family protein n=1 Tax=unclassified Streptomyces TaxID=2593676 RepID=UPI0037BB138B
MSLAPRPQPAPAAPQDPNAALDAACATVTTEIGRTDSKASLLLAFVGATLAGLASVADTPLPLPARITGAAAILALAAAAVLLLLVVRPSLGGRGRIAREGVPCWSQMTEAALLASMREDTRATRIRVLSTLAVAKFERLARAVDIILAALALLLAAAVLALTTG